MDKKQCAEERNDKEMILHPEWWPMGHVLPMKQRGRTFEDDGTGVILEGHPTVILIGIIGLTDFGSAPTKSYESIDAMLADGWVVD